MATLQQVRSQNKQGQWASIFPNEQVTETQSTLFVKKLLAVAVSSISYLRALFPENAFGDRCLEDVNLKILRDDSNCPEACKVIQWIRGCFDALEKKYLRAVLIGIYEDPEDADTVIEQYSFKFAYGDGGGVDIYRNGAKISTAKSDKETKKATIRLLRTIVLLSQTLSPLPDDVMMTMKLLYYDEVTPEDYNPPGFKECDCDNFNFKEEPMNIRVGDVATQYHAFKLRIKTLNHDLQEANNNEEPSVVPGGENLMEQNHDDQVNDNTSLYQDKNVDEEVNKENIDPNGTEGANEENSQISDQAPDSIELPVSSRSNTRVSTPASSVAPESEEVITKCPCGVHEDDGLMILCAVCNTWQHATCFAILKPDEAPEVHYCVECNMNTDNQCTDYVLAAIEDAAEVKDLCLWRRGLVAVVEATRILASNLAKRLGITVAVANRILKRMETEGFVQPGGKAKRFGKLVQKEEILKRGYDKYFHNLEHEQDEDITMVTEKASNLQLGSKKKVDIDNSSSSTSLKRKASEVVSLKNKDLRFELSNSQQSPSQELAVKKRRKSSVSTEPMRV